MVPRVVKESDSDFVTFGCVAGGACNIRGTGRHIYSQDSGLRTRDSGVAVKKLEVCILWSLEYGPPLAHWAWPLDLTCMDAFSL